MPIRPTPTPPGETSPSIMCTIGTSPPSGVKLSCMQLTEPFEVPVVDAAHSAARSRDRSGSPCPPCCRPLWVVDCDWSTPSVVSSGLPPCSAKIAEAGHRPARCTTITAEQHPALPLAPDQMAEGDRRRRTGSAGSRRSRGGSCQPLGFSNGWAELALKKPPPLVPSCLMASCEATGPPGIAWSVTSSCRLVQRSRRSVSHP